MKTRILLVDDNPNFLQSVEQFLLTSPANEIVGKTNSGTAAIEQAMMLKPDLILMDLKMPGMNGLVATQRIKASPNPPLVVLVTLYDNDEYRLAARTAGADGYIVKSEFTSQITDFLQRLPKLTQHLQVNQP